jgi:hypothetical protein
MPDGIEEWCAECNMRIGLKRRLTDTWKVSLSDDKELDQAEQSEYERHQKVMDWQSHDWARRPIDRDKSWDKIEMVCMACGARSKPNDHDVPHCRELEPTEAEAPMDPDKIRAELQKAVKHEIGE